jgi:hypothetical protein
MTALLRHEPGQNCQDRAARIGLPAQGCKDKPTRQKRKEKTARKGKACEAARTGQPEWDRQNKTAKTELTE